MQAPFRLVNALRLHTEVGLVASMAVAMATFSATPLVLSPLADEFGVSTGTAALFSAAQLGAFVVGSWTAGRFADPSRRIFVAVLVTYMTVVRTRVVPRVVMGPVPGKIMKNPGARWARARSRSRASIAAR